MSNQDRKELISKYLQGNSEGLSAWQLAKKVMEDHPTKFKRTDFESLRAAINRLIDKPDDVTIAASQEQPKYQVVNGNYTWKANKGIINLSVDFIDQLFYEYSEHGLNLSQVEIINKHNLQIWQWNTIKNTLWLFKKSHIFSPHTVDNTPKGELDEMVATKIDKALNSVGHQVVQQYNKQLNKKYKEVIRKQTEVDVNLQQMILELMETIPHCEVLPAIRSDIETSGVKCHFIFDLHFGAESRKQHDLPVYSPAVSRETLLHIADVINAEKKAEVHIFLGGDLIETLTGLNHKDSWKGIARGYYGSTVIMECYRLLVEFIGRINNVKAVYGVAGNHDRATANRDEDGQGIVAEILFEMIKLAFAGSVPVKYDERIISEKIDGINYILTHGHMRFTYTNSAELILEYGDPYAFNLLVSGHYHSRKVFKDSERFRHLICPSIFPGNDYSKNLGFSSTPGFISAANNNYNNKPLINDYPL